MGLRFECGPGGDGMSAVDLWREEPDRKRGDVFDDPFWSGFLFLGRVINYTRAPTVLVAVGALVLILVPQGRDLAAGLTRGPNAWLIAFGFAVLWMGVSCWAYARLLLHDRFDCCLEVQGQRDVVQCSDPQLHQGHRWKYLVIEFYPRVLSVLVFLGAATAVFLCHPWHWYGFACLVVGTFVFAFYCVRRRWRLLRSIFATESIGRRARWVSFALAILTAVALFVWPVDLPQWLGSGAVFFLCLATMTSVLSTAVYCLREGYTPLLTILVFLFGLSRLSVAIVGDNHHLRRLDENVAMRRPSVEEAFRAWHRRACKVGDEAPLVVVATAGGGLRASYWTSRVLAALQDHVPSFRDQLFAVSGASGGAVGATLFVAWQASEKNRGHRTSGRCKVVNSAEAHDEIWSGFGKLFETDYLAPGLARFLGADLAQRFIPYPVFSDRAAALEQGWEAGFAKAVRKADSGRDPAMAEMFSAPFGSLYPASIFNGTFETRWRALLLINGTHQQSGARILTTPLAVEPSVFPDTRDAYDVLDGRRDLPISTAAHNAARFAFVSPSGTLGAGNGHIIDGGYLENHGAQTTWDLLQALIKVASATTSKVRPIVIQITNDAGLDKGYLEPQAFPSLASGCFDAFNDEFGPLFGLLGAMSGRARSAGAELRRWPVTGARALGGSEVLHVHLRLFENEASGTPAPLGWVLSEESRRNMDEQLFCCEENRDALTRVVRAITGTNVDSGWLDYRCCSGDVATCATGGRKGKSRGGCGSAK